MRTLNSDPVKPNTYKPYELTARNVSMVEDSAKEFRAKFYRLIKDMKYDPDAARLGCTENFARAQDCIVGLEQLCEVLEGPYRNEALNLRISSREHTGSSKLEAWRNELKAMKEKFEPIQYSEQTLRILFPERYQPATNVTSTGSSPPLKKRAS